MRWVGTRAERPLPFTPAAVQRVCQAVPGVGEEGALKKDLEMGSSGLYALIRTDRWCHGAKPCLNILSNWRDSIILRLGKAWPGELALRRAGRTIG